MKTKFSRVTKLDSNREFRDDFSPEFAQQSLAYSITKGCISLCMDTQPFVDSATRNINFG
jgi:hypothetical protein